MKKYDVEVSGKMRSTTMGNADWYYGGGEDAWNSIEDAVKGVPVGVRSGKTVGVKKEGVIVEYIWHPSAIGDSDLVLKSSNIFQSSLKSTLISSEEFGSLEEGTPIGFFKGKSFTEIFEQALFKESSSSISRLNSCKVSGIESYDVEVGTSITKNISVSYDQGEIVNGDGSVAGSLTGESTKAVFSNIQGGNIIYTDVSTSGNSSTTTLDKFKIIKGDNTWKVVISYESGDTVYKSSYGKEELHLSSQTLGGELSIITPSIKGYNKFFLYKGKEKTSPNESTAIRSLVSSGLIKEKGEIINLPVSVGGDEAEISIYVPQGNTIMVKDVRNLYLDITSDFESSPIIINDGGGSPVDYIKYTRVTGPTGYTNPTSFNITIE